MQILGKKTLVDRRGFQISVKVNFTNFIYSNVFTVSYVIVADVPRIRIKIFLM